MVILTPYAGSRNVHRWRGVRRLACAIVGHDPAPGAVWNHGYGFARCARCEASIMRAVFGGWRVPPAGYRIVWPDRRKARVSAPIGPRAISNGDFMTDGAHAPPPRRASTAFIGDFMAEDASPSEPPRRHQAR